MKVRNLEGTSDLNCKCENWLQHWVDYGGYKLPQLCPVKNCREKPVLGAHVQKTDLSDQTVYIVPLCDSHNKTDVVLDLYETTLVLADKRKTCDKPVKLLVPKKPDNR